MHPKYKTKQLAGDQCYFGGGFKYRHLLVGWGRMTIFLSFYINLCYGQTKTTVIISYHDHITKNTLISTIDSVKTASFIQNHIKDQQAAGYLYINVDSFVCQKDTCKYFIFKGEKYIISQLNISEEQKAILESSGIKKRPLGKPLDSITIQTFLKTLTLFQANNGYPFANAGLKEISMDNEGLSASLYVNKGKMMIFDTVVNEGRLDMKTSFYNKILDIKPGKPYQHDKVTKASARLRDLQYLTQRTEPFVRFINDKAYLVITPDPRPASRFDFLIGVLPQVVNGVRKWNITGDVTAEMTNAFRRGEYTFFQFKRVKPENLELLAKSTIPFVFNLPVGSHLDFRLFKNANQNLDLYFDGGIQYLFGGFNQIKVFGSYRSSSLLDIDLNSIVQSKKLPERLDVSYSGIGVSLSLRDVDYRFNPSKGYTAEITTVAGRKSIIPNRQIIDIAEFKNSYDTLKLSTLQAEIDAFLSYFTKISNWATVKTSLTTGIRYNEQALRTNELMRVGGNRLLRGFDEESLLTDFYGFGTAEFRIIFDQNSYLSLPFVDFGYIRLRDESGASSIKPIIGVGMGLNFGTNAGVFNLSFAAGRVAPNPIDFGRMKIHFGYVNLF
jgi:outer membrane protein assembly factor BamA